MRPLKTEAIKQFLLASTHADLAALYNFNMEMQLNVAEDGGTRIDGDFKGKQWHGFSDGVTTWKPIRIPWNAATNPHFEDSPMSFDLAAHCEGIGLTGWDWKNKKSLWVGYDFDAMTGHSDQHGGKLTDQQLKEVQKAAWDIPWISVRRSTSGNGLHLYVHLDGTITTANHNEHAALARAIIGIMAAKTGFDFHTKVDICGGNMWFFHRKMKGTDGLILLKKGEILSEIPGNWRDHVAVIKGSKKKTLPAIIEQSQIPEIEQIFDDLTSQRAHIQLDEEHRRLVDYLNEKEARATWDQDRHMLTTHTAHLKQAHEDLSLRGIFDTISTGEEQGDINCFLFPMRKGAWAIRRFTPGVSEHPSWCQDGSGWTQCYFNREPDLSTAAKSNDGIEHKSGGFVFPHAAQAVEAAKLVGVQINLPTWAHGRKAKLKESREGKLIVEVEHDATADAMAGGLKGWIPEGKTWSRVFQANLRPVGEVEVGNYDDVIRHLISETEDDCGWTIKSEGQWVSEPLTHVKIGLQGALGLTVKEATAIIGSSVFRHWKIVNRPFQPEYPGDRQWNRGAAQFRYHPTENRDNLQYPTWMKVLRHCGRGLDDAVKKHPWCKSNLILTGADYLKVWVASLFQFPQSPLPYLFLYSQEQNTGKSIFHEALSELVTHGVARADTALTNPQGFNGELANAVLCVIEEIDLSRSKVAYNRIKDWVTSRHLPVHTKGLTPYTIPNSTHWVQTANDHRYCPVFAGDTRITMIHVQPIEPAELIPKNRLIELLRKEASDFMAELLHLEIPNSNDRLNVPVVVTGEKLNAQRANLTRLQAFIQECCFDVHGRMIKYGEFVERFHEWLDPLDVHDWSKIKTGNNLPPHFPKGRRPQDGQFYVGNISWQPRKPEEPILPKLILNDKELLISASGE